MSPLRNWIRNALKTQIPSAGTIWSDTHPAAFETLTGVNHKDLLKKWFEVTNNEPDYNTKGTDPRFTTCSSFLPRFATQIRIAGHLPTRKHNVQLNKDFDIGLRAFELHTERGWTPAYLADAAGVGPQEGDFFQLGHGGMTDHVGIIAKVEGDLWTLVAGGAGGRGSKHDGVKRTPPQPRPGGLMGWLSVDVYFEGWNGVDVGDG